MKARILASVSVLILTGCVSPLDQEHCEPYGPEPEKVRMEVFGAEPLPASVTVQQCIGSPMEGYCVITLAATDVETLFPARLLDIARPAPGSGSQYPRLAAQHGFEIAGGLSSQAYLYARVYYNTARDHAIVMSDPRCSTLREVISRAEIPPRDRW